jgi:ribosome-interacting GTPase 1
VYVPALYVVNKIDQITLEELEVMDRLPHYVPVSNPIDWLLPLRREGGYFDDI